MKESHDHLNCESQGFSCLIYFCFAHFLHPLGGSPVPIYPYGDMRDFQLQIKKFKLIKFINIETGSAWQLGTPKHTWLCVLNPNIKCGYQFLGTTEVVICFSFRLFGAKAGGKSASAPNTEGVKSSSVMPSPSTTLARQGSLESPSSGTGSMGSAGGLSGSSSPLFNKPSDLTTDVISLSHSLASSPASVHSFTSGGLVWAANLSSSSAGSKDTPSYQSMTSLHTSSESIDLPLSHHGSLSGLTTGTHEVQSLLMRTGSVRSTLSER